jgi:hypothetical protein
LQFHNILDCFETIKFRYTFLLAVLRAKRRRPVLTIP